MSDRNKYILILIFCFVIIQSVYLLSEYLIAGSLGVPLDDVWIHFRFAENFSSGYFFQYNLNEPTPGTTSPLWVIILSFPFLIGNNFILPFALFASSMFFLILVIEFYRLCRKLGFTEGYAFVISLLTLLNGRLLWSSLSGMEITLFTLLTVLIICNHLSELYSHRIRISTGFLMGLAVNVRPEAYLLALIYYAFIFFKFRKNFNFNYKNFLISLIIFVMMALPYPVFSYIYSGSFLPNTYEGQVGTVKLFPDFRFLTETGKLFFKDNFVILILWIVASAYFIYNLIKGKTEQKLLLLYLWIILLPALSSIVAPNWRHHGRYLIPLIPFINIAAIDILQKSLTFFHKRSNLFLKGILTFIFALSLFNAAVFAHALGWNVENINNQQVKTARWLRDNLSEETAFGMNDIGAITFITKKYCVDLAGLVTPEVFRIQKLSYEEGAEEIFRLLKSKNVNYIIIYPDWFEYIIENYKNSLEQVYSAKLEKNTICGGAEKIVYKIHWDKIRLD
ncbi:MAG: hypothetical protein N2510_04010 [Ignavibacteria bacterium]|nr:hypothetical protein [Ignavibacteria bacterium]